jgi:protein-tyrosine phosphatase
LIDLHCHLLPGIDDGAGDIETSLQMARMAAADGIKVVACTPHILPPVYNNTAADIISRTRALQAELVRSSIDIKLIAGADIHVRVDLAELLGETPSPCLQGTRYFLFEPPHTVLPPNLDMFCKSVMAAGYIPILTHPERLTWIEQHYDLICALDEIGVVIQLTAGSITGTFGKRALYWSERMLDEGRVDIIATDAHGTRGRPPILSAARSAVSTRLGEAAAKAMTVSNPARILKNERLPAKARSVTASPARAELWTRLFGKRKSDSGGKSPTKRHSR